MAIANRLLAVEDWASEGGGVYDRRMATLALQLACTPPSGPPRSSGDFLRRLDLKKLQALWRGDDTARADLEQLVADPQVLAGLRGRYSAFFRSLAGKADGCWGLEDVDLAVLTIPTIASRQDADAAVRLVLEDLGHFATKRKARVGDDVLLVLDEFSAVQGGTEQAIHLAERLRDVGVPVVFGAQSPEGLGDERQQWRLLHTIGGGLVLHQTPDPGHPGRPGRDRAHPRAGLAAGPVGPAGQARVRMTERPRVDPNRVRQLHPGEAFLVHGGRAVKLSVLQARCPRRCRRRPARCARRRSAPRSRSMWPRESLARHPRWSCGALPATTWTSPTSLRCRPWKHPRRPRRPRSRRGRRPCRHATPAHPAGPAPGRRPTRPGHHRRRRAGRPAAGARLGSHCRTAPPAPQAPVAAVAAARVPALPGPGGPPETGAPCLRRSGGSGAAAAGTKQPVQQPAEQGDRDRQRHQHHQPCHRFHPDHPTPGTATVPASLPARLSPGKAAGGQGHPPGTVPAVAAGRALAQERRLARARSSCRANSPAARTSAKTPTKARTLRTPLRVDGQPAQVSPAASLVGQFGRSAGSARGRGSACTALAGPPAGPLHPAGRPICWQDGG
jgi:hypothetical protein